MRTPPAAALAALRESLSGPLHARGDDGYLSEIEGFNSAAPMAPDYVVGAATERDVQLAVRFAADNGMTVAVQATGHGSYAPVPDGVLIRTHRLDRVAVDLGARAATIGAGAPWRAVLSRLVGTGLTAITGAAPGVGVVGFTLGGGIGPLSRTLGFAADRVRRFRVVTGEGLVVEADGERNPDLFRALKGGKIGLGVVVETTIDLIDLPTVYAGGLFWAEEHIEAVLRAWVDWTAAVPDTINSSVNIVRFPAVEEVPVPLRGRTILHLRFAYVDRDATPEVRRRRAEELLAPLRAVAPVHLDTIGELPTTEVGTIHADPEGPLPIWERGLLLDPLDQDFVTALLPHVGAGVDAPYAAVEIRQLGGALTREPPAPSAIGGRGAAYSLFLVGVPDVGLFTDVLPRRTELVEDAIAPFVHAETNYNWAGHPTPEDFARLWPAETAAYLDDVRRRHDPAGVFAAGRRPR